MSNYLKTVAFLLICMVSTAVDAASEGKLVTVKTVEGVDMTFRVYYQDWNKGAYVAGKETGTAAIATNTQGTVTVPSEVDGVPVIGIRSGAFGGCSQITKLIFPATLTSVENSEYSGGSIFRGCDNLETIVMDGVGKYIQCEGNCVISVSYEEEAELDENGDPIYDESGEVVYRVVGQSRRVEAGCKTSVIPDDVTSIAGMAFMNVNIETISLPSSITQIGDKAFSRSALKTISLPVIQGNSWSKDSGIFESCLELTSVTLSEGQEEIGIRWFYGCYNIKSVVLPSSITNIDDYAFADTGLTSVQLPKSITSIGDGAFAYTGLTSIQLPVSITSIGNRAFSGTQITEVDIPANVNFIGRAPFNSAVLETITFDGNNKYYNSHNGCNAILMKVEETEDFWERYFQPKYYNNDGNTYNNVVLQGCKNTVIPEGIQAIGNYAFYGCPITDIRIPSSCTFIDKDAFAGCEQISSLDLPANLKLIYDYAFTDCKGIKSLNIPQYVETINRTTFYGCSGLESITVSAGNTKYDSRNNCNAIIEKDVDYYHWDSEQETRIEKKVSRLLLGCKNTKIPDGVELIGDGAFDNIEDLKSITLPSTILEIEQAFRNTGLETVYSYITDPSKVTAIFVITYNEETGESNYPSTLYVPKGSREKYLAAEGWNKFGQIIEMDTDSINSVHNEDVNYREGIYSISGQRLNNPTRGLNVIGGRKVLVK
jgi:hypothetical protein